MGLTSVTHVEFLSVGDEFLQGIQAVGIEFALVGENVIQADAAVGADFVRRDFAAIEEPNHVGARKIEKFGYLLGGEFGVDRQQPDVIPLWPVPRVPR